ncbi:uncharacterized protein LOC119733764 [Patiria miniata]|uniref:Uncharacterized protein n=1 Tax=Patiria miniata TaxID=46514 RepID=A0A914AHQ1_PATMI|nr:uncharacterized protein LOC119733764 [Patiria miniata]
MYYMRPSLCQVDLQHVANYFHTILSNVVDELLSRVDGESDSEKYAEVSTALRSISYLYREGLSQPNSESRSDWSKPENQCAYVYLYFMQHCYMMYMAMQPVMSPRHCHIRARLEYRKQRHRQLRVCSIGGGPGSDVLGLSKFLEDVGLFPESLHFTVLDLWPEWAHAWQAIKNRTKSRISVNYERCDLVGDAPLSALATQRLREADILTLEKSFSAVVAFMNEEHRRNILLTILCELKLGCLVVFVDNRRRSIVTGPFFKLFARPTGLRLVNQWEGLPKVPVRGYSKRVQEFRENVEFNPMSCCVVTCLLFVKTQPGCIQNIGLKAGISYGVYRRSVGDYGGFYEDTPRLKNIWFEEYHDIPCEEDQARLDDFELEYNNLFGFTEYGDLENNFRDMTAEKKLPCWARTMKTNRRKLKRKKGEKQKRKVGQGRVNARTNKMRKEIRRNMQAETPRGHRTALVRHSDELTRE